MSLAESKNITIQNDSTTHSRRNKIDVALESGGVGLFQYRAIAILGLGNASDAIELSFISYVLPQLPHSVSDTEKSAISAALFAGMLIGGVVSGLLSDRLGRKPLLLISLAINTIFGIASAFAPMWEILVLFRTLSGIGVGGSAPLVFSMTAEFLPTKRRGLFITLIAWWWLLGSIYTAGFAWLMMGTFGLHWKYLALVAAAPSLLALILTYLFIPESPRYLFIRGNIEGCVQVLAKISQLNGRKPYFMSAQQLLNEDIEDINNNNEENKNERINYTEKKEQEASEKARLLTKKESCWPNRFGSPFLRDRALILGMIIWFTLSFGWYGLILWMPTLFKRSGLKLSMYEDSFLATASNLPGNIVSSLVIDWLGRKKLLSISMGLASILAVLFAFYDSPAYIAPIACLFNAVSAGGWNALDCISSESFPTTRRATAMGLLTSAGRVGSIVAQFINGYLIDQSIFVLLLCTAGMMFAGSVAGLLLPVETSNKELEDNPTDE